MTNAQKRHYRAQGIDPAQMEQDIRQREHDALEAARQARLYAEAAARAERLTQANAVIERLESDLAQSGAVQRETDPDAVDMAPLAQTPRRATRRRLNPVLAALVGGLLIGMKGDER